MSLHKRAVDYESFRTCWTEALRESRLPGWFEATEKLDIRNLDRTYSVYVEPLGGQDAQPFHVTAKLEWCWTALTTARMRTRDDDVLIEMLGRDGADDLETEKPCVRVDIKLRASAPYDKPLLMPSPRAWAAWVREVMGRLERIEPLIPDEDVRVNRIGMLEVLAWQDQPKASIVCGPGGDLMLESVEIRAMQLIELPRRRDGSDREPDDAPDFELEELFGRLKASLSAWMQAVDLLRPR